MNLAAGVRKDSTLQIDMSYVNKSFIQAMAFLT
jgi:hypothetical protein